MTDRLNVSERAREAAADLAAQVYGNRIANDIRDGTTDRHHFLDAFVRFEQPLLDRVRELEAALKRARRALAMQPLPTTFNEVENKRAELAAIDRTLNRSTTDAAE